MSPLRRSSPRRAHARRGECSAQDLETALGDGDGTPPRPGACGRPRGRRAAARRRGQRPVARLGARPPLRGRGGQRRRLRRWAGAVDATALPRRRRARTVPRGAWTSSSRRPVPTGWRSPGSASQVPAGCPAGSRVRWWSDGRRECLSWSQGRAAAGRSEAERYVRLASASVGVVRRVLPEWRAVWWSRCRPRVRRSTGLDAEPGHTAGIAAVTAPADGSTDTDSPVHVFVNPEVFDRLQPTGAQVVLSHEAVHVATDAARSDVALAPRGIRRLRRPPRRRPRR